MSFSGKALAFGVWAVGSASGMAGDASATDPIDLAGFMDPCPSRLSLSAVMPDPSALKSVDGCTQPIRDVLGFSRLLGTSDKGNSVGGTPQSRGRDFIAMDSTDLLAGSADPSPSRSSSTSSTALMGTLVAGLSDNSLGGRNQNSRDAGRTGACCSCGSG